MRRQAFFAAVCVAGAALSLPSCGGIINNPAPSLKSLSPSSVNAGGPAFVLTVNGNGFAPQSGVLWNGSPRLTTFLSGNQLTVMISFNDIAFPGTVSVVVVTPAPGGGTSNAVNFTIHPVASPIPQITSISPTGAFAGGNLFTVTVVGSGFVSQSVVTVNGNNRATAFLGSTTLQGSVLASDIKSAGTLLVGVLNPLPGGGASNAVPLAVTNPSPILISLSPTSTAAGGSSLTLTVNGTGFDAASAVNFDGSARTTTFVSNIQVTAALIMDDLAAARTVPIQVVNPAPGGGSSNTLNFLVNPGSTGAGLPELVDVDNNGVQANNGIGSLSTSGPVMSSSGRFIAFASLSSNLVPNDTNAVADIFLRDTCLAAGSDCVPQTLRASLANDGAQANGPSSEPSTDSSGRFVAFTSTATNLVPGVTLTGNRQVFLRDTCAGTTSACGASTRLISLAADGVSPANSDSFQPAVSPDGRFVAFVSAASNLVSGVTPGSLSNTQIFLRDTCAGQPSSCKPSTALVTVPSDGSSAANGASSEPAVGKSSQFISFSSTATNLVSGVASGAQEIFVRNTCSGAASGCTAATAIVSTPNGAAAANGMSSQSALSPDGRFFAFSSTATNLVGGVTSGVQQIFLRDTCAGVSSGCNALTSLVSVAGDGTSPGGDKSERPQISANGQIVAFASLASNLVANDANGVEDVFARNTCAGAASGCTARTALASVSGGITPQQGNGASLSPALSGDGKFVSFISFASNLVGKDTNGVEDVFLAITTF